jgi:hypothetical protein
MVQALLEWNSSPLHFHQTLTYVTGRTKQCIRSRTIKFLRMSIGPLIALPAKVPTNQKAGSSNLSGRTNGIRRRRHIFRSTLGNTPNVNFTFMTVNMQAPWLSRIK